METIRLRPAQLPSHVLRAPLGREHVRTKTRNMAAAAARPLRLPHMLQRWTHTWPATRPLPVSYSTQIPRLPIPEPWTTKPARTFPAGPRDDHHRRLLINCPSHERGETAGDAGRARHSSLVIPAGINAAASLAAASLLDPRPGHPFRRAAGGGVGGLRRKAGGSHRRELAASFRLGESGRHSTFHITTWQWHTPMRL